MKSIVKTLLVTAVTAVMATSANAADLVLKFGHVGKPGSLFDMSANEFARVANAKLGGWLQLHVAELNDGLQDRLGNLIS